LYYIFKKKGDDPKNYIIFKINEKCIIHNSYSCGCKKEKLKYDSNFISKYIEIYKLCSKIIDFSTGGIRLLKSSSKISIMSMNMDNNIDF